MRKLLVVTGGLLFATNLAMTVVFALMWMTDCVHVSEPNLWIRTTELLISVAITLFGLIVVLRYRREPTVAAACRTDTDPPQRPASQ